jgi:hypothetical protein
MPLGVESSYKRFDLSLPFHDIVPASRIQVTIPEFGIEFSFRLSLVMKSASFTSDEGSVHCNLKMTTELNMPLLQTPLLVIRAITLGALLFDSVQRVLYLFLEF